MYLHIHYYNIILHFFTGCSTRSDVMFNVFFSYKYIIHVCINYLVRLFNVDDGHPVLEIFIYIYICIYTYTYIKEREREEETNKRC